MGALERSRLLRKLDDAIGNGLTIVEGPPGAGKTVLLSQFASQVDFAVRWLTLDFGCRFPEVLATRLARTLLQDEEHPEPVIANDLSNLRAYLGNAMHDAADAADRPLLLILDDYHEIADSEEAGQLLSWVVAQLPTGADVMVASRAPLDFAGASERIFSGETTVLTVSDLVFTKDEVQSIANAMGKGEMAEEVATATGGWPIAVVACLRGALKKGQGPAIEMGDAWQGYMMREIWSGLPEGVQNSLLAVSVAPVIDTQVAMGLIGQHAWWQLSDWLNGQDLLVERLESGARLNPVFRTFLRQRYRRLDPPAYDHSLRTVVAWLEQSDMLADAISCALTGNHVELLAELVERHAATLIRQGSLNALAQAFATLPLRMVSARPALMALKARTLSHTGGPSDALALADTVLSTPAIGADVRHNAQMARRRALRMSGRARELAPMLNSVADGADAIMLAEMNFADAEFEGYIRNNYARALDLLALSAAQAREAGATSLELIARSARGQFLVMRGDTPAAIAELTTAVKGWRQVPGTANLGWALNDLGMSHLCVGDMESAIEVLKEAVEQGERCGNLRNTAYARASLAEARTAQGDYEGALADYAEVQKVCHKVADGTLACLLLIGHSAAYLGAGDIRQADYLAREAYVLAESMGVPAYIAQAKQQIAMVLLAVGDTESALVAQHDAVERLEATESRSELLVAYYRLALCYFRAHKRTDAARVLEGVDGLLAEPWMAGPLIAAAREHPMFAQWACSRRNSAAFKFLAERGAFERVNKSTGKREAMYPAVMAESLGHMRVTMAGKEVPDEAWSSSRAKELFFLLLASPNGLRKDDAVLKLYPDIVPEKTNSIFHSNLHRLRKALYAESVIKRDGIYLLNPEGSWDWDVAKFEEAMMQAARMPAGSEERASAHERALTLYQGPFAEQFYSEWAETVRRRVETRTCEAIAMLAGFQAGQHRYEEAALTLERLLAIDEFNLDAMFQLAVYRARAGHNAAALTFLDRCRTHWQEEYREPLPERFTMLRTDIAAGRAV